MNFHWNREWLLGHPVKSMGIILHLTLRTLFAIFWIFAGINKIPKGWLESDILRDIFLHRLTELPPDSFAVFYLQNFAIPLYQPVAWAIIVGEIYSGLGLLFGFTTRWAAAVALFILVNFSIGGYYDASLIVFYLLCILFLFYPSGHWLGVDRALHRRHPANLAFR